jgi:hypothetical protein
VVVNENRWLSGSPTGVFAGDVSAVLQRPGAHHRAREWEGRQIAARFG